MRSSWPWPTGSPQICRRFHRKRSSGEIPRPIRQGPAPQSADARERARDEEPRHAQGAAIWPSEETEEEVTSARSCGIRDGLKIGLDLASMAKPSEDRT